MNRAPKPLPSCRPPWWARGGHAQTLMGHFLHSPAADLPWERLSLILADGDTLKLRLAQGTSGRVVYLFHGLGGSVDRDYMQRAAARFHALGDSVLAVNHRGAGEGRGSARRPYHSGAIEDAATVVEMGRSYFPNHQHLAIGYSLSANILLLLLGKDATGELAKPDAVLAVNPPVDLDACSIRIGQGLNRLYDLRFLRLLRQELDARWKAGLLTERVRIPALATLREFDDLYTAPAGGFRDKADYYQRCSSGPHLASIQRPAVILSAEDDPFAPASDILKFPHSPAVILHVVPCGGHVGYLSRDVPGWRWLEEALVHYADAVSGRSGTSSAHF
jgi:predicted alpha/beta-fold hydrolase